MTRVMAASSRRAPRIAKGTVLRAEFIKREIIAPGFAALYGHREAARCATPAERVLVFSLPRSSVLPRSRVQARMGRGSSRERATPGRAAPRAGVAGRNRAARARAAQAAARTARVARAAARAVRAARAVG